MSSTACKRSRNVNFKERCNCARQLPFQVVACQAASEILFVTMQLPHNPAQVLNIIHIRRSIANFFHGNQGGNAGEVNENSRDQFLFGRTCILAIKVERLCDEDVQRGFPVVVAVEIKYPHAFFGYLLLLSPAHGVCNPTRPERETRAGYCRGASL